MAIVDTLDRPLQAGERGELTIRPRHPHRVMLAYHNKLPATMRAFRNLWFHTGDAAMIGADGQLHWLGRIGDTIRRRGVNISSRLRRRQRAGTVPIEAGAHPSAVRHRRYISAAISPPASVRTRGELVAAIRCEAATSYHQSGTCAMGAGESSVVDTRLRVKGVDGLRVADTSIILVLPNAALHAVALMIGEKAAAMILEEG